MGYDINRFRPSDINEEFICTICQDVLKDPLLVEKCEHVFCGQCINEWLEKSENKLCPIDRIEITDSSLRPPQRSFRNMIASLLISCDFHSNGCEEWIKIDEISTHVKQCVFNPLLMNEEIDCPSDCGAKVKRCKSLNNHNCVLFLKEVVSRQNEMIAELKILIESNSTLFKQNLNFMNEKMLSKKEEIKTLKNEIQRLNAEKLDLIENKKLMDKSISASSQIQFFDTSKFPTQNSSDGNLIELFSEMDDSYSVIINKIETENIETSRENRQLVEGLQSRGSLQNSRVISAMMSIDRGLFAPSAASYSLNYVRAIGYGAHTGPSTYEAKLLQYLEPHLTNNSKVLDIGSGTGYLTSCIARMIQPNGKVIGIDHIPELVLQSIQTVDKHYPNLIESEQIKFVNSDGRYGYSNEAPFDLIFIEPLTRRVPQRLIDQLKPGGVIIVPMGNREKDIILEQLTKQSNRDVIRLVLCDDWSLMRENTLDLFEDKKMQLRGGWKMKLGF